MYMTYGWPQVIPLESGNCPTSEQIIYLKLLNRLLLVVAPSHLELWTSSQHRLRLGKYKRDSDSIQREGHNLQAVWSPDGKFIALLTSSFYLHILKVQFTDKRIQIGGKQPSTLYLASISLLLNEQVPLPQTGFNASNLVCDSKNLLFGLSDGSLYNISWKGEFAGPFELDFYSGNSNEASKMTKSLENGVSVGPIQSVPECCQNVSIKSAIAFLEFSMSLRLLFVLFCDGQLVLCSVSKKGLKQADSIKVEKQLGSGDATCTSVASEQQILAVGTRRGIVELYDLVEPVSIIRSVSVYDWGYSMDDTGAVSCIAWTPDHSAFAVGWKFRGLTVWSVSGCRLMSTIRQTGLSTASSPVNKSNQDCKYEPILGGTSLLQWDEYGYKLYAIEEGSSERIIAFSFGKCCLNRGVSGSTYVRQVVYGEDRLLVVQSEVTEELKLLHINLPVSYISQNWPILHVAASKDGMYLAVAGLHGLIIYDVRLNKWRLFGDITQEQKIQCRGLLWMGKIIVVCNYDDSSNTYELLFYPRYHLDQSSLLYQKSLLAFSSIVGMHILMLVTKIIPGNHKEKGTSKLVSPNVVARLMGLDGFPSPEVIHRSEKAHGDGNRKIALPKMSERDAHWHEPRSYKKSYVEQSEFKDVFEDTINKSGSNIDSAMEVLQQSDSSFLEHLCMQKSPSNYGYNRIAVLKPSNSTNQKAKDKGRKDEREGPMKDGFVRHTCNSHGSQSLFKSSITTPDREGESDIMAKRIVILKPNYLKSQNAFNPFSSPDSSQFNFPIYSEHKQYEDSSREGYYRNMDIFKDVDISRRKSREVTETVKKATREMRDTYSRMKNRRNTTKESNGEMFEDFGYMANNFQSPFRGSPDIRDLYDFYGNVSASESEETKLTCDFTESFASNEAKKRLLERLKKAYNYQDVIVNSKRSIPRDMYQDAGMDGKKITLGEMLSTSDKKIRNLDVTMGGISSKDGWKDSYSKFSSRSRSICQLPGIASEKHNADGECRVDDKLLVPKEDTYQYQRKVVDRDCKKKDNSSSKNSRSSNRRSQSNRQRYPCNNECLLESYSSYDQMETNINKEGSLDKQPVVPQTSKNAASIADAADIIQHGCRTISPRSSDELPTELSIFEKNSDDSSVGNKEDSTPQRTKAEAEFSESSKEADHPSPVSVLQVPIREDDILSGPESFEQVSADLRELQKQLQLLRRETKSDEGDSTPPDTDYDIQQGSVVDFENRRVHKPEWWESSYIVDVLNESGFDDTDADMFTTICYSPDCPLGPWVFDNLESKHYGEVTRLKHDRRLLFDRINSALSAMPKSFAEPCPWVRPSIVGNQFKWQACEIREELYKLLEGQVKEANEEDSEKLLDKEMNWVGLRDSVDAIGMEIEKLLTAELLTELLNDVKFSY